MALRKDAIMIDRSDVISLISNNEYQDEYGVWRDEETERDIFVSVSSISSREWHSANQTGLKAEFVFTCFAPDYQGEENVKFKGVKYLVYRTYKLPNDLIELYVTTAKGVHNGN